MPENYSAVLPIFRQGSEFQKFQDKERSVGDRLLLFAPTLTSQVFRFLVHHKVRPFAIVRQIFRRLNRRGGWPVNTAMVFSSASV